jgi:hypothetical protein
LHAHPAVALRRLRHVEYFYDHARIERMLFAGTLDPVERSLVPDSGCEGTGMVFKHVDAVRFAL